MKAYVSSGPAGLGKTRQFAERVAHSMRPTHIYVPTHRLAIEWRDHILKFNPHKRIRIILGRDAELQPGVHMCAKNTLAAELNRAGIPVYQNLCSQSQGKGVPPTRCSLHSHCQYIAQFQYAEVYIYTHAHLALERGALETSVPAEVIIDESFFQALIEKITLPISLLTHPRIPSAARGLCSDVAAALKSGQPVQARFVSALKRGGDFKRAMKALNHPARLSPADTDARNRAAVRRGVNFAPVQKLLTQLADEVMVHPIPRAIDYDPATGDLTLHHRKRIAHLRATGGKQPEIFILDASASRSVVSRFFEIGVFARPNVARNAHVVQCSSTMCSTTSLDPSRNKNPKSAADATRRIAELTAFIAKLAVNDTKVLVIGPVAVVGNPRTSALSLISVPAHCALAHFNAVRGVDAWKDFQVVVIVGRNEPPIDVVEDMARALWFDDPQPVIRTGKWDFEVRGYRTAGTPLGVDSKVHADARVQEVVEQLREHESLQSIDRLRLLRNPEKKLVIVLSNLPLDIDVDETRTWKELMQGTRLEQALEACDGVLPLNAQWLAARFPASWSTEAAAKKDMQRAARKGHFSNSTYIRKMSPFGFEYKGKEQRRWSSCLSTSNDARLVETALRTLVGADVSVRSTHPPVVAPAVVQLSPVPSPVGSEAEAGRQAAALNRTVADSKSLSAVIGIVAAATSPITVKELVRRHANASGKPEMTERKLRRGIKIAVDGGWLENRPGTPLCLTPDGLDHASYLAKPKAAKAGGPPASS